MSLEVKIPGPRNSIKRNGRRYLLTADGAEAECVSVTTILDKLAKPGLQYGAQKVVANTALDRLDELAAMPRDDAYKILFNSPKEEWGAKARFGTAVHEALDAWLKRGTGEPTDVADIDQLPYIAGASLFLDQHIQEVVATEITLANVTHGYAGTVDLIARTKKGKLAFIDWKTGKDVWPDVALQITGYVNCDLAVTKEGETHPHDLIPDMGIVVHLTGDANYKAYPIEPDPADWEAFLGLLAVQRWTDTRQNKALGTPKEGRKS